MSSCFPHTATITQRRGGSRDSDGVYVEAFATQFTIRMSFQPINGVERNNLPEGQRKSEIFKAYFEMQGDLSPLQIGTSPATADTLTFNSIVYIFTQVQPWEFCTRYMKALVMRRNNQDDA